MSCQHWPWGCGGLAPLQLKRTPSILLRNIFRHQYTQRAPRWQKACKELLQTKTFCVKYCDRRPASIQKPLIFQNAQSESAEASWEPFGRQAPEMLKMSLQKPPESHLAGRAQKCSKWPSRGLLRAIWPAGPRNAQNEPADGSWEPFGRQAPEMLEMSLQKASCIRRIARNT